MYTFYTTASEASPLTTARPTFGSETGDPIFPNKNEECITMIPSCSATRTAAIPGRRQRGRGRSTRLWEGAATGCSGGQRAGDQGHIAPLDARRSPLDTALHPASSDEDFICIHSCLLSIDAGLILGHTPARARSPGSPWTEERSG